MGFITDQFLLQSKTARRLYEHYAVEPPLLDYHSHMSPADVAADRRFHNLYELWLEGDHYKWRAMRANGVPERFCTGDAEPYEKFLAWAGTVPHTLRNPLYHWTHLELKRYFGIDELLDERSAPRIWREVSAQLQSEDLTVRGILDRFRVRVLCTTDDPTDSLDDHRRVAASGCATRVYPTFRPDRALRADDAPAFSEWLQRLEAAAGVSISTLADFQRALEQRHSYFHQLGCRLSDHGLNHCYAEYGSEREASAAFAKARTGKPLDAAQNAQLGSFLMLFFGQLDAQKGWTKQLHLGALRSVNTRALERLGRDVGCDSIGDWPQAAALAAYMDRLDRDNALPRMVIYNLNPADNYAFAALAGAFFAEGVTAKVQFGSGWWFLDQKEGIELQLNALSNCGLLSRFIGMLTDSRSWMSFPRHEYFRRVLCNLLGGDVEAGLIPDDEELLGRLIGDICFHNAARYLGLELPKTTDPAAPQPAPAQASA